MCWLINIISAKFEENWCNISKDILDFVICFPPRTTDDVISFNISPMIWDILKMRTPCILFSQKIFKNKPELFFVS